jgi:hypothetical protein
MADSNALDQLKTALADIEDFLTNNGDKIKALVHAAADLFPPINTLIDILVELLDKLKTIVENLQLPQGADVAKTIQDISQKSGNLLAAIRAFLSKDDDAEIKRVEDAIRAVGSLADFDKVKTELLGAIKRVRDLLAGLKSPN